ncbi:MAG: hypothetical protein Q9157_008970 [Trypethelium eluteriae]
MSWKGFQKSVTRAPQQFRQRFNVGENTKDAVYVDAERRFAELEKETKRLHDESQKYFDAINGMLNHQKEFSKAIAEIYKPISGRMSDPDSYIAEGNPEGIRACEEYEEIIKELQTSLQPELEMIETRVIRPADELLEIIKVIQKTATKRDHKQLDYDRHRASLKKIQDKKEKTLKDEKALYKAENDVEQSTQEFDYYNNLLKDDLPKLFRLEREFIGPLFQSFYYMQLNVFYTLHEKMQSIDVGYFDLQADVEAAFEKKRGDAQERTEALAIVHFKATGGRKPGQKFTPSSKLSLDSKSSGPTRRSTMDSTENPPPPYSANALSPTTSSSALDASGAGVGRANSTGGAWGMAAKAKGAAPPPPKPKPSRLSGAPAAETVTALYDYEAQAEGDLSFTAGDTIEIIERSSNENEWWTGRVGMKSGQFPELVNIHSAFHQGQFSKVLSDYSPATFSTPNQLPARVLQLRARLALGEYDGVISEVKGDSTPDLEAIKVLAEFLKDPENGVSAAQAGEQLAEKAGDNLTVQICCSTVFAAQENYEQALALLAKHQGTLDAVALIVQIHLLQNRTDLAVKEARNARNFAQDSLLVNLAESWVGMREGGERYQQAFYVFEELAQAPATTSTRSLVGQITAEIHLGRLPEAEAALQQALENIAANEADSKRGAEDAEVLANAVVLNTILGKSKEAQDSREKLEKLNAEHVLLKELNGKREAFEAARAKYAPQFEP